MSNDVYSYSFRPDVNMDQVKETLQLATMAVEGLHGRSRIQLDASFQCDLTARKAEVVAGTEVGDAIARIFTALLSTAIGEPAFKVERVVREEVGCWGSGGKHCISLSNLRETEKKCPLRQPGHPLEG